MHHIHPLVITIWLVLLHSLNNHGNNKHNNSSYVNNFPFRKFWRHVHNFTEELSRLTEQDVFKAPDSSKLQGAISLSLLKKDTMSVRGWLKRFTVEKIHCMHDLIYAYHGLSPLLRAFSEKVKFLNLPGTDPECAQLLAEKLVKRDDNYIPTAQMKTLLFFFDTIIESD